MPKHLKSYIVMNSRDNCATALKDIPRRTQLQVNEINIIVNENISLGHKFALKDIKEGDLVKKYGHSIGIATVDIKKGDWIHTHNLVSQYLEEVLNK